MRKRKYILVKTKVTTKKGEITDAYVGQRLFRRGPLSFVSFRLHGPYTSKSGRDYYVLFVRMRYNRSRTFKSRRYGR